MSITVDLYDVDRSGGRGQGFPAFVLDLKCSPAEYDVTYEPAKSICRFKDEDSVFAAVHKALAVVTRF